MLGRVFTSSLGRMMAVTRGQWATLARSPFDGITLRWAALSANGH